MLIELKNVSVNLGGQPILEKIDLKLKPGRITAILGQSGSGLTVLLKTIAGLIRPTSGQVVYDGRCLEDFSEQEKRSLQTRTGFVFQDAALWANKTLAANLDLPLQAKYPELSTQARSRIIEEALQQCAFSVDLNKRPMELSHGQQQFLSFLRAVIPGPEALVLDEPIAYMDRSWGEKVTFKLKELRSKGTTLALGSHGPKVWLKTADRLVILHQGKVLIDGSSDEVQRSTQAKVREIVHSRTENEEVMPK